MARMDGIIKFCLLAVLISMVSACGGQTIAPLKVVTQELEKQPELSDEMSEPMADDPIDDTGQETGKADSNHIHVAVMLPLTGANEDIGKILLQSVTLGLFDAYDPRIKLFPLDTKGTLEGTEAAAQIALDAQVQVVIGPLLAANVEKAGSLMRPAGIPVIGLSNDRTVAARGQYILGFLPENEVRRILSYSHEQGYNRLAALIPDTAYGERILESFGQATSFLGGDVQAIQTYGDETDKLQESVKQLADYDRRSRLLRREIAFLRGLDQDMSDELAQQLERAEKLEAPSFDGVLIPEGGDLMRTLSPLLPYYEVDPKTVQFLGTSRMNDPSLWSEPSLQGSWFASVEPSPVVAFEKRYTTLYGIRPPKLASIAYDAMGLVSMLVRQSLTEKQSDSAPIQPISDQNDQNDHNDRIFTYETLENIKGFVGVNGLFRFLPDGTNERALAVLEISRRAVKIIDPAPKEFPSFGYMVKAVKVEGPDPDQAKQTHQTLE